MIYQITFNFNMLKNTFNSAYILLHIKWKVNISIFILFIGKTVKYYSQFNRKSCKRNIKYTIVHRNVTVMFLYLLSFDFISYIIYTYQFKCTAILHYLCFKIYFLISRLDGRPYALSAFIIPRLIAIAIVSAANTPTTSRFASTSPVLNTKIVSPSLVMCTGRIARA